MSARVDAVIIGAGIIGASIAYHLRARKPDWRVLVLEAQEAPGSGETRWATGGVRHQFGTEANIRLTQLSIPYFEAFAARFGVDPDFRRHGYLFVTASNERFAIMQREAQIQRALGVPTEHPDRARLAALCPPLRVDDIAGANYCALDGSINPHWVMQGFLDTFKRAGGEVRVREPVQALAAHDAGWTLTTPSGEIESPVVVIATGPQSRAVAALARVDLPAHPFARQVFVAERQASVPESIPLTVDMDTGWYAHAHGPELLLGGTDKDQRPGASAEVDWALFDAVFAAATHRMPTLADARIARSYAGVRTLSPDHHAILGPVPGRPGLFLAAGFSGHGIMHSPAVGLLLSEWIVEGAPRSWDARVLSIERFTNRAGFEESAVF